ncbi:MAG: putative 2-dehydropantoate 2-reductase [Kiritimatiellae bacterium]|nr:putative 2-dehydropantoate 2-reductase [Kiritimatiellia bacterium]MDD5522587.1 putative 2-dehydropantoate 2-reductase [Kiritimatiellia bacterium]
MSKFSYAIIGTGAVGGLYGARLQRAGYDVHFLLHSDFKHVKRHGLRIDSVNGNFKLPMVKAYRRASDMPQCDVVVVTLKATANHLLPGILPHAAKTGGVVIIIQNGLGAEKQVAQIVPKSIVLGGMSFLCSNKIGPGHIHHIDYGQLALALYTRNGKPGGIIPVMEEIAADFTRSGTPVKLISDLVLARWKKLVWNIPFNGLSVLLNASTLDLVRNPNIRALAQLLMEETAKGAAAFGRKIPKTFLTKMMKDTEKMAPYNTSMKLDFLRDKPMEIEAIYGEPLRTAVKHGARLPHIETLYHALSFLNSVKQRYIIK